MRVGSTLEEVNRRLIEATLADRLVTSGNVGATPRSLDIKTPMTVGQTIEFPVTAGQTYTFTKYVDVESSNETADTLSAATVR